MTSRHARLDGRRGFTIVELLVSLVISSVVLLSLTRLLAVQGRAFGKQRELGDVNESLRTGAAFLAWELRQLSPADGDIYAMGQRTITVRSITATGIVCAEHATQPLFALSSAEGDVAETSADSALILNVGGAGTADDDWKAMRVGSRGTAASLGVGNCVWDASTPDAAITVQPASAADTAGVAVGAPVRLFRRVEYALYQDGAEWWLGQKVAGAASYEKLTGPLLADAQDGLEFRYYDAAGTAVAVPAQVAVVEIRIRSHSTHNSSADGSPQTGFLVTKVAPRG